MLTSDSSSRARSGLGMAYPHEGGVHWHYHRHATIRGHLPIVRIHAHFHAVGYAARHHAFADGMATNGHETPPEPQDGQGRGG